MLVLQPLLAAAHSVLHEVQHILQQRFDVV
jgi:hypothetical protein